MNVKRWEDDATVWHGPDYGPEALSYHPDVASASVAGRIITCVDVVDWTGTGARDLLLSTWDPCYDGKVFLRRQIGTNDDGTPILGEEECVEGVRGYVTAVPDGEVFHLVSASRMRRQIYLFPNIGRRGAPEFGEPVVLELDADWVKGNEYFHMVRFHDIDGDGVPELIVGSDSWDDYWPNGLEWNDEGYRGYDAAGRWLGGPLRGFLYAFKNTGSLAAPVLEKGRPLLAGDTPLEVYGQLAPAFGTFRPGETSLIAGEFWNILHLARQRQDGHFEPNTLVRTPGDEVLELDQCIHLPCVTDWNGDGRLDILVGAEDGYVTYLRNCGEGDDGQPRFEKIGRVQTTRPLIHAGVLPSPAAHDFTGDGRPDLVVGNSTGELLFYANRGDSDPRHLDKEVMLTAAGQPVRIAAGLTGSVQGPSEKMFGYTCPTVADWTGSGAGDLLVSDVTGYHRLFRNLGKGTVPPVFAQEELLTVRGKPLKTVWRVRPAVTDWGGDGPLHYLALDEDGVLSDWTKVSDTELADKRHLKWEDGRDIRFTVDVGGGRGRVKLCLCDWEGSGRTDLIFGTHARACVPDDPATGAPRNTTKQAGLFYARNVGTPEEPRFALPVAMKHKGETIAMAMHVASPEAVDWAGRGALDLIVGVEDGSMVWLKREDLSWQS
ncbi:FG-GAP repeat domain-containing protein [Stappia sp. ICDLI1TA098]